MASSSLLSSHHRIFSVQMWLFVVFWNSVVVLLLTLPNVVAAAGYDQKSNNIPQHMLLFEELHRNFATQSEDYLDMYTETAKCVYCFEGASECMDGPCRKLSSPFVKLLQEDGAYFTSEFDYLTITHNTMTFHWSDFMITSLGCKAMWTGIGFATFNDDNKVVEMRSYSSNSHQFLECFRDYMQYKMEKENEEKKEKDLKEKDL